jgi:RHS repeat-associated protein
MFTGREFDEETGLYYYRARMYSSKIGRFLQPDPIGYYDSANLYQYCGNNPVNFVDPMGLCEETIDEKTKALLEKLARWLEFNVGVRDSLLGKYGNAGYAEAISNLRGAGFLGGKSGLSMHDINIAAASSWIGEYHPELMEGIHPNFVPVDFLGDAGGMAGFPWPFQNTVLVDTDYASMEDLVGSLAHELTHAQLGFLRNQMESFKVGHNQEWSPFYNPEKDPFYQTEDKVERDFRNWLGNK